MALAALHIDGARRVDEPSRADKSSRQGALARVIAAAYDGDSDDAAWLEGVVRALAPLVGRGNGVSAWQWSLSEDGLSIRTPTYLGCATELHEAYTMAAGLLPTPDILLQLWRGPSRSWSESLGVAENLRIAETAMRPRAGIEDVLGLYASRSARDGLVIATPSEHVVRVAPRTRAMLGTIADHLGAAQRFRARAANAAEAPEAVLDGRGRLLHLEPAVERNRDTLAQTIAALQATASLGSESPAHAAALWSSLVKGEWSVVHHTDSDGKRLILARRNPPGRRDAASLTPGERSVAELFARGHSPKAIGYELGVSPAVISSRLQVAAHKLGLQSYHELVAIARGAAAMP